ncbi:MAG: ATPase, partial [Methanobacterium sp.]
DFEKSITNTVPLSVTQAEKIRAIREWANIRAVAATSADDRIEYNQEVAGFELEPNEQSIDEDIGSSRGGRAIDL